MDRKLIVAAGGVLGVVAIAYLLSRSGGANTGGVMSGGMWGFPASGYTAPSESTPSDPAPFEPAPPVNIDFPGVTIPPMQPPVINYPEVTPVNYYQADNSGGDSTKKQTVYAMDVDSSSHVDSSSPSSAFGGSSGFGGGGVGGRSGDEPTTVKKTPTGSSMGGFGVSHSAPPSSGGASSMAVSVVKGAASVASLTSPVGAAVAVGSAIGKKAVTSAPSIASIVGSVTSSIGGALSSIGKVFGW